MESSREEEERGERSERAGRDAEVPRVCVVRGRAREHIGHRESLHLLVRSKRRARRPWPGSHALRSFAPSRSRSRIPRNRERERERERERVEDGAVGGPRRLPTRRERFFAFYNFRMFEWRDFQGDRGDEMWTPAGRPGASRLRRG